MVDVLRMEQRLLWELDGDKFLSVAWILDCLAPVGTYWWRKDDFRGGVAP